MTLDVRSFLVGAAGVLGLLVLGFGGGVMMSGVLSDETRQPNRIERQAARDPKPPAEEIKPASPPIIVATPAPIAPAQVQVPAAAPAPPLRPDPQPVAGQPAPQAKPEPPPVVQALPPPLPQRPQVTVHSLGPEKPVALTEPSVEQRLSRREAARLKAQQRREERVQRREERRREIAERRQQDQMRRGEIRSATQRSRFQEADADDDDDDQPPIVTRQGRNDFPFFRTWER